MGNYVTQLEISIERGGVWNATLLEGEAPETCEAILDVLLVTSESGHAVFARMGVNPIGKAVKVINALGELDELKGGEAFDCSLDGVVGGPRTCW